MNDLYQLMDVLFSVNLGLCCSPMQWRGVSCCYFVHTALYSIALDFMGSCGLPVVISVHAGFLASCADARCGHLHVILEWWQLYPPHADVVEVHAAQLPDDYCIFPLQSIDIAHGVLWNNLC